MVTSIKINQNIFMMNPMANLEKHFKMNGTDLKWSEHLGRRRLAMSSSDSDSTTGRDPQVPVSLLPTPPPPKYLSKNSSSCSCSKSNCVKKQSETNISVKKKSSKKKVRDYGLQQVEAKLYNAEMEEAIKSEQLKSSKESLHRAAQILEAQEMLSQSLDLKARAIARLTELAGNFVYKDLTPTKSLEQALDSIKSDGGVVAELRELQSVAFSATELPEHLYQRIDEFREKRSDYHKATDTFSQYLHTASRVSPSHLREFNSQYDLICSNYNHSRQIVESEFAKLIQEKHDILAKCFSKLVPVQEKLLEQDNQFLTLSKEIAKCFHQTSKKPSYRHLCQEKCSTSKNHKYSHHS